MVESITKKSFIPVRINRELCKGCGLCVEVCPHQLIRLSPEEINKKGYHPAIFDDPDGKCILCTQCALVCPDVAIEIVQMIEE